MTPGSLCRLGNQKQLDGLFLEEERLRLRRRFQLCLIASPSPSLETLEEMRVFATNPLCPQNTSRQPFDFRCRKLLLGGLV
jgi:hypothetical protein